MPMYDFSCPNGHETEALQPVGTQTMLCRICTVPAQKVFRSCPAVRDDSIPGGMTIHNMGPQPETFYSRAEHKRRCKELGLTMREWHAPLPGEDGSPHTTNWAAGIDQRALDNAKALVERM